MADEPLTSDQRMTHYVEMWKQTVTVQQHFNDIEWRIRGLALTAATFAIGAAAVATKDGKTFAAGTVLAIGLLLWYAFYFVDRYWYHPLLKASVDQGHKLEAELASHLPAADLTQTISAGSPIDRPRLVRALSLPKNRDKKLHSVDKLIWFYRIGAVALALAAGALLAQPLFSDSPSPNPKRPIIIKIDQNGNHPKHVQPLPSHEPPPSPRS